MNSSFPMNHDKPCLALSAALPLQSFIFKRKRPDSNEVGCGYLGTSLNYISLGLIFNPWKTCYRFPVK